MELKPIPALQQIKRKIIERGKNDKEEVSAGPVGAKHNYVNLTHSLVGGDP